MPARRRNPLVAASAGSGEDRLVTALLNELPALRQCRSVVAGAGDDDCAVIRPPRPGDWQLLKTDCVIEGVHFASDTEPARVGWKALCLPLSDIAATGGIPVHALVTFALSTGASAEWARKVYAGIGRAARAFGVDVVGGETASTPGPSFLSVCLTGRVARNRCVTRGGGRVGDFLYVTGRMGGSLPSGRHLDFRPRLAEAQWLVSHFRVHAMMDLSDGLAADLPRLTRASGTGFIVEPGKLPLTKGCTVAQALGDGEDYELLFAVGPRDTSRLDTAWKRRFPRVRLTRIGSLAAPGTREGLGDARGYDHFGRLPASDLP